ncbi:co-chaperone GroES [Halothermothrix orenii]|uniref:Co-chaperonin GroES n=1 Tax=Halothermothrix orenii (strain H 168 / OCM 544 / DSM 9562) TaxID=373903 RepID=CH10_HALOH|nr:co-chaperone GroES [Halothermothrix orenii]B8D0Z3.1 RecName: Full=Co-chaperonin GroES; AltName: Full=10 kDa chaperonin; AltName: Full=Chaperonin-10; Short=Cpn10 [Halothermothrix orenii H 168]ACL68962.1 Chaperonin GroES (HSP10) [Halothermothrix orenii H 168]
MNIKPLNDRVAVKYLEEEEKTRSGIVLPDTAKEEKPQQGEIVAVGKGCTPEDGDPEVKVGDLVVFDKYSGTKVTIDGEDYIILNLEDVLAVIEK